MHFAGDQGFDGDAANVGEFDVDAMFIEKLFVLGDEQRQHGGADGAVGDAHGGGVGKSRREEEIVRG